jgi:hypothetical protein
MKRLIEFPLEGQESLLVEVDEPIQGGLTKAGLTDTITKAQHTLEESLEKVKPAAQSIIKKLRKLSDPPDEVEVSFGIKLSAEAGAVLASSGVEANYTVTLKWVKEAKPEKSDV